MTLDLERLREVHPDLPEEIATHYALCAAAALFVGAHEPGVSMSLDLASQTIQHALAWRARVENDFAHLDMNRATENGAEAIALAVVGAHRVQWRLVRRLQSRLGERGDWLFEEESTGIAFEISGTIGGDLETLAREKLAQASSSPVASRAAACVVRFREPRAIFMESTADADGAA
ncbi:MAG: hypothetical protein ACHREM_01540 [Polyangiales bacterium]